MSKQKLPVVLAPAPNILLSLNSQPTHRRFCCCSSDGCCFSSPSPRKRTTCLNRSTSDANLILAISPGSCIWGRTTSMPFVLQRFRYILTGLYAIQVYDWLLTLGDEVALIQQAPWTSAKLGYFICRYYPLWAMPVSMYAWLPNHERSLCVRLLHPSHIILIPLQLCPQAVMLMRAYAFTGRKKAVLVALLPCYALLAGLDIWGLSTGLILSEHLFAQLGRTSCVSDHGGGALASRMGAIMASAVLMDLVSLVVVVSHALRIRSFQGHLGKIFIRQGIFSFAIALSANLVAAIIYFGIPSSRYDGSALPFSLVFTNLTAARMILSLRRQVCPTETQITRQHSMLVRHALATDKPDHWTIH